MFDYLGSKSHLRRKRNSFALLDQKGVHLYRSVHVKSFDNHPARAILGARTQLVGMTTRLSNHIRGVLKTFGMLPGAMRRLPFDRKDEVLLEGRSDVEPIVRPMLVAWRQLRIHDRSFRQGNPRNANECRLSF